MPKTFVEIHFLLDQDSFNKKDLVKFGALLIRLGLKGDLTHDETQELKVLHMKVISGPALETLSIDIHQPSELKQ